jgi:hypothetical protein
MLVLDQPPRHLSSDKRNPHYNPVYVRVGVRFDGVDRTDVNEYDADAGWIRIRHKRQGRWVLGSDGRYVTTQLVGLVEPYFRAGAAKPADEIVRPERTAEEHSAALEAAARKRAMRAAKLAANIERSKRP